MRKDTFLNFFDTHISKVYEHYFTNTADKEKAKNYTFMFFTKLWDKVKDMDEHEASHRIDVLLKNNL